jgi:hypothetical protein
VNGRRALPSCTVALDPHPRDKPQASLNGAGGMHMNAQTDANFIGVASERGERICDEKGAGMMMSEPWWSTRAHKGTRCDVGPYVSHAGTLHSTQCGPPPKPSPTPWHGE